MFRSAALGLVALGVAVSLGSQSVPEDASSQASGRECHVIVVTVPPYQPTVTFCPPVR